ncbi:hypothetical protein [Nannocystis pusilla]|uniref:hypothetical protein n=1 Tax=Nannocystis pusilla TaxID=889268 RepID=UPI003DA2EA20
MAILATARPAPRVRAVGADAPRFITAIRFFNSAGRAMMEFMSGEVSRVDSRIRRARVNVFGAELDLRTRAATIFWHRSGKKPLVIGEGEWVPLPEPMGDLRGKLAVDGVHRRTCALLEHRLARGNRDWTYESGPWISAEATARAAGVDAPAADALRKVSWLFYCERWPLQFADGCGWGSGGYGPLIAAALTESGPHASPLGAAHPHRRAAVAGQRGRSPANREPLSR